MMNLTYLTQEAYDDLRGAIPENRDRYAQPESWLDKYFVDKDYMAPSTVEVDSLTLTHDPKEDATAEDLLNTMRLYSAFKSLTPLQATNGRMWTCLAHTEYYEYAQKRWANDARENWIVTRMFTSGSKASLTDNAISRLWWYGYLTYDSEAADPFHLTRTLLLTQQSCTDLLDLKYSSDRKVCRGMLLALQEYVDGHGGGFTSAWRDCVKYINRYGATTNLDFMTDQEIKDKALEYLVKWKG